MIVKFTGVLYDVRVKRDGGARIQIDIGGDGFEEMIQIQRFFKDNNISVAMALTPIQASTPDFNGLETIPEGLPE